jgi:hypothetical protein
MSAQLLRVSSASSALAVLLFGSVAHAQLSDPSDSTAPQSFPEFYDDMVECMTYFRYVRDGLEESGAPQADVEIYAERALALFWLHSSIGNRLSRKERRKALSERNAEKRMKRLGSVEAMQGAYDAKCVALHDNFDTYVDTIERRLELASGEPYVDFKGKCVTVSTDWLSITGRYFGMFGPTVKQVPSGGLRPLNFGSDDRYRVGLALGNQDYWDAVEIPPPPGLHKNLLAMGPEEQARVLSEPFANYGIDCEQPHDPYFRGLDTRGRAFWAVTCESGDAFSVWISDQDGVHKSYKCNQKGSVDDPQCYAPCSRSSCYTLDPKIHATYEDIHHVPSIRVELAPQEACPTDYGGFGMSNRYQLPDLDAGEKHHPLMAIIDAPPCNSADPSGHRTLEILATRKLDMLKVDFAHLEVPPLRLDQSAGAPCELVHVNPAPGYVTDDPVADRFADIRCRLVADPDEIRRSGPVLTVTGRFKTGDPFDGQVEACTTPID